MRYTCKNCGCELPDDAQFCTRCGTKVSAPRCPSCGRILPEDAAFCTFCGTRLAPEETRAENTTEQSVESLPENPTVELEPTSSEKAPESASSPEEAASASLPTQQACPPEPAPLPPNAPPDAVQPSAGEQAVPSASEPIEEGHPDTASGDTGNAPPAPAPDVPALPADAEPPAFLLDGKSDIFQRLKQYEQNGDTRSEEYSRLRKQEKSAYFWYKLLMVLGFFALNLVVYFLFSSYGIAEKAAVTFAVFMVLGLVGIPVASRISDKSGIKVSTGLMSIFADKSVSQAEEKIADAGMDYCMNCIRERHSRAHTAFYILLGIAMVFSILCGILCLNVGMGFGDSIRFGVLLWFEIGFLMAVVWTWKGWLLLPLLLAALLYASSEGMIGSSPLMNYLDSVGSTAASGPAQAETAPDTSAASASCVTLGDAWLDLYDGRTIVVISYSWTNTTGSEDCAIYNVSLHGYQNGIELEKAYFADIDSASWTRNVKPGATIQLEEAFYLDDPYADLLVEAAPWLALDDTIYASTLYTHQEANSTGGAAFSDLVGAYSYDASFEVDGMYVDGYYALLIYGQSQSVQISEYWRGNAIFNAVWASEDSWDGSTLYFDVAAQDSDYDDMAGTHFLTFVPAAESPYGVDTIYIDGDTDMPFTRDSY